MIIWLVLYSLWAQASDPSIQEFCFQSPAKMKDTSRKVRFILIPDDRVLEDDSCLTVRSRDHRRELIKNYIQRVDPSAVIGFSSAELKREPCKIKVEKEKAKNAETATGSVDRELNPTVLAEQSNQDATEVMTIQTVKDFELTVNQDTIKGSCKYINSERYEIDLTVLKAARPLLPPLPEHSIVIIPNALIPPPQDTARLQTSLQINRGERIEIGSLVKNLKNSSKNLDVNSQGNLESSTGAQSEKVFLMID